MGTYIQTKTTITSTLPFHPYSTHLSEDIPPFSYPGRGKNDNVLDDLLPTFSYLSNATFLRPLTILCPKPQPTNITDYRPNRCPLAFWDLY
jgi:hypothetical protein